MEGVGFVIRILRTVGVLLVFALAACTGGGAETPVPEPAPTTSRPASTSSRPVEPPSAPPSDIVVEPVQVCFQKSTTLAAETWRTTDVEAAVDGLEVRHEGDKLIATRAGQSWTVFTEAKANMYRGGPIQINRDWLVFLSADSLDWDAPWRLNAWSVNRPDEKSWVIGEQKEPSISGFPLEQLRGSRVVWSQGLAGGGRAVMMHDLGTEVTKELARGNVYAPMFVGDDVVVWQSETLDAGVGVAGVDVGTGQPWAGDNPITRMDAAGGQLVTDGTFWILANVRAGEEPDRTYTTWFWRTGNSGPQELLNTDGPVYVPVSGAVAGGYYAFISYMRGPHVADLNTGYVYRLWPEWADVAVDDGVATLRRPPATKDGPRTVATLDLAKLVPSTDCDNPPRG